MHTKSIITEEEVFTNIEFKEELENNSYILKNNNLLVDSNVKWTHHFLTTDELNFLATKLKQKLKTVDYYTDSKPGIVTAANNFFIINRETEKKYNLSKVIRNQ